MLLQVIEQADDGTVAVVFNDNQRSSRFMIDDYQSSFSANFRQTLNWYYQQYPRQIQSSQDDQGTITKLLTNGRYLGDALRGEDDQLIGMIEHIEAVGYPQLKVEIIANSIDFFNDFFEAATLYEAKYVLSTVVQEFTRKYSQQQQPALNYQLAVTPKVNPQIAELAGKAAPVTDPQDDKPLVILSITSRPTHLTKGPLQNASNNLEQLFTSATSEGAIHYELAVDNHWHSIKTRLNDHRRPVHIVHFDGPVLIDNQRAALQFGSDHGPCNTVSVDIISKTLIDNQIALLCVDARSYHQPNGDAVSAQQGLATIAWQAEQAGLGNVIGLGQLTDNYHSSRCFARFYQHLSSGLSVAQAVVESRKSWQSQTQTSTFDHHAREFHLWPLAVHYSTQQVQFFATPQAQTPANEAQITQQYLQKLLGFKATLLPPNYQPIGDGQTLSLLAVLNPSHGANTLCAITGMTGSGKTQLLHQTAFCLMQQQQIDYGFYFDFAQGSYQPQQMLEMIAPVFQLEPDQLQAVEDKLTGLCCAFILDNFLDNLLDDEEMPHQLIDNLLAQGHKVMVSGKKATTQLHSAYIEVAILPLSADEQQMLAVQTASAHELTIASHELEWQQLISACSGNPWLIKKRVAQLKNTPASALLDQIGESEAKILAAGGDIISCFYQRQWQQITPFWQQVLLLASDVEGMLLEMLNLAWTGGDKNTAETTNPLIALLEADPETKTDAEHTDFTNGLQQWQNSGFIKRLPYGHIVDPDCLAFLRSRLTECPTVTQEPVKLAFSQILCQGIGILSGHLMQQQNPAIQHNLLLNRRHWVLHFERLWFGADYQGFIVVKRAFEQLLQQAQLTEESNNWCLDLLKRTPAVSETHSTESQLAWLAVANQALQVASSPQSPSQPAIQTPQPVIEQGARFWQSWLEQLDIAQFESASRPTATPSLALFQQSSTFLQSYYQQQQQWQAASDICLQAYLLYRRFEAWPKVIQMLKSLAQQQLALNQPAQAYQYEQQILDEVPYEHSPPGFHGQQQLDVILSRMSRGLFDSAQQLLDKLNSSSDSEPLAQVIEGVQTDLYYESGHYLKALPFYTKLWLKLDPEGQQAQNQQRQLLEQRLQSIADKLGHSTFEQHFSRYVPDQTINPIRPQSQTAPDRTKLNKGK